MNKDGTHQQEELRSLARDFKTLRAAGFPPAGWTDIRATGKKVGLSYEASCASYSGENTPDSMHDTARNCNYETTMQDTRTHSMQSAPQPEVWTAAVRQRRAASAPLRPQRHDAAAPGGDRQPGTGSDVRRHVRSRRRWGDVSRRGRRRRVRRRLLLRPGRVASQRCLCADGHRNKNKHLNINNNNDNDNNNDNNSNSNNHNDKYNHNHHNNNNTNTTNEKSNLAVSLAICFTRDGASG